MEKLLQQIGVFFPLTELDAEPFARMKVKGLKMDIRCFYAQGLGHLSAMTTTGFCGLMKMDTLILNPFERDMPLLSHDRIRVMGKDTLCMELYDTMAEKADLSPLDDILQRCSALPDYDPGAHWYDSIKLPQSIFKKSGKKHSAQFDALAEEYLNCCLQIFQAAPPCDPLAKRERAAAYSANLLAQGGPAVNVFMKKLGRETTTQIFRRVLFGA